MSLFYFILFLFTMHKKIRKQKQPTILFLSIFPPSRAAQKSQTKKFSFFFFCFFINTHTKKSYETKISVQLSSIDLFLLIIQNRSAPPVSSPTKKGRSFLDATSFGGALSPRDAAHGPRLTGPPSTRSLDSAIAYFSERIRLPILALPR